MTMGEYMRFRTRRVKAGLISATVLLSTAGLGLATASPASANSCYVMAGVNKEEAWAKGFCSDSDDRIYRKFVWNNGPDSICVGFRDGLTMTHERPYPWSTFEGMKAC